MDPDNNPAPAPTEQSAPDDLESRIVNKVFAGLRKAGVFKDAQHAQQAPQLQTNPVPSGAGLDTNALTSAFTTALQGFFGSQTPIAQPAHRPAPVVIDRGPPAPGVNRDVDSILETDPLSLSQHDIARLKTKHGDAKARELIQRNVNAALMGRKPTAR
ncbi:MAG: hypothetical protein AB7T06_40400 [Kofleriaceae bacterium]